MKRAAAETAAHAQLKRLAFIWAQVHGYSACALEASLPRCRYRADIAGHRPEAGALGTIAIFECKQAMADLRRDNYSAAATRDQLKTTCQRRLVLEKNLRIHYPSLRIADTLFPEFDSHDFAAIRHRGYGRVVQRLNTLQNRLSNCTKFDKLIKFRCANLFYLVLPDSLMNERELPPGWGVLVESADELFLARKPVWHDMATENQLRLLQRIAAAGTRVLNRQLEITFEDIATRRRHSLV